MRQFVTVAAACALLGAGLAGAARQAASDLIRVHVFATESASSESLDREAQARADSADDLRTALQRSAERRELMELVEDRDRADVLVEVIRREQQMTARAGLPGNLGSRRIEPGRRQERTVFVYLSVPAADHEDDIEGVDASSWRGAADAAAATIEAWVRSNLAALRASRR